jgi:hypothetical protein
MTRRLTASDCRPLNTMALLRAYLGGLTVRADARLPSAGTLVYSKQCGIAS